MKPFLDSTDVFDDGPELQSRMQRDGYLFIRGLLPSDELEALRLELLEIASAGGWVKSDRPLKDAVADLNGFCVEPEPKYNEIYYLMYKLQKLHALQHHPSLLGMFERMLGEAVMPHPRLIGRTLFPQREAYTTPAHQDFIPIQGTADTYTAWIPLSDLPPEMGGLQIASGSHRGGVYDFRPAMGAGGMEVVNDLEGTWVNNPFKQSDVLIFHSMAVHKGLPCTGDRLRMSIDARYQKLSDPISPGSLQPHGGELTWEEVYADWPSTELQYYWHPLDLETKEYDTSYLEKRDNLAFELAEKGDTLAISALQRIISRDADPAKKKRAEELLATLVEKD